MNVQLIIRIQYYKYIIITYLKWLLSIVNIAIDAVFIRNFFNIT